jgi:hypothetical protein
MLLLRQHPPVPAPRRAHELGHGRRNGRLSPLAPCRCRCGRARKVTRAASSDPPAAVEDLAVKLSELLAELLDPARLYSSIIKGQSPGKGADLPTPSLPAPSPASTSHLQPPPP